MRRVRVWDVPTRIFHWMLAGLVLLAYLASGEEGTWAEIHVVAGYGIAALIVFRVMWGVIGPDRARFRDLTPGIAALRDHLAGLARGSVPAKAGHTPMGSVAILAMLAVLLGVLIAARSGLFEIHETLATAILVLVGVHVAGVVLESLLLRQNLPAGMIHGGKRVADTDPAAATPPVGRGRLAAALGVVVLAVGVGVPSGVAPWPPGKALAEEHEAGHAAGADASGEHDERQRESDDDEADGG